MLKLDSAALKIITGTARRITELERLKDGLGAQVPVAIDLPGGNPADPLGERFTVSSEPVRKQIDGLIADHHRVLRNMGIEFVG